MKERLTNLGFLDWLKDLDDPAPYPVMFFEIPKFIQLAYIKRWAQEVHNTEIMVKSWIESGTLIYLYSVQELGKPSSYQNKNNFNTESQAMEAAINETIDKIELKL